MRRMFAFLAASALAALWCGASSAADQPNFWTTPTIGGYGKAGRSHEPSSRCAHERSAKTTNTLVVPLLQSAEVARPRQRFDW